MKRVQPVDRFHGRTLGECSSLVFSNPLYSPDNIPIALTMSANSNLDGFEKLTLTSIYAYYCLSTCSCPWVPEVPLRQLLRSGSPCLGLGRPSA